MRHAFHWLFVLSSVCLAWLCVGCGERGDAPSAAEHPSATAGPRTDQADLGTLQASLPSNPAGVSSVTIVVSQNGATIQSQTLTAGAISDGAAGFPLADAFFVLPVGTYTVTATALDPNGNPLEACKPAVTQARVEATMTTEVVLTLLCTQPGNGGLDTTISTSLPPVITNLVFSPNKFTAVCDPVTVTVTATDETEDAGSLTYTWSIVATPAGSTTLLAPGTSSLLVGTGSSAVFDTAGVGDYTARVVVTNSEGQTTSLSFPLHVLAGPDCSGSQQLGGYVINDPTDPVLGPVPATDTIDLSVGLPMQDAPGLQAFIHAASDPHSSSYRQYMTPSQFNASHGAADGDYKALQAWATSYNLQITASYGSKLLLSVRGAASDVERAIFANLIYRQRSDGNRFVSVDREPSLALAPSVLQISGLNEAIPPQPGVMLNGTGGGGSYRAADIRAAYLGVGSSCQGFDGTGEVVGVASFAGFDPNDVSGYDGLQVPARDPSLVSVAATEGGISFTGGGTDETTLDIEMVQAMAPKAQVLVFEGNLGITGHADDIFHTMAAMDPPLSSASCSWTFGRSQNSQQALDQMAAEGVSFFNASGDFGDVGDPQANLNMGSITLVGGTRLSTNPLSGGAYPASYYAGDSTWNDFGPSQGKDVTGGGIMNGNNQFPWPPNSGCFCFPYPLCCGSSTPIPDYQVGVDMSNNGGSPQFRNYPDVSLLADNVELFFGGSAQGTGGTSAASPLWAGFAALVDQASRRNSVGVAGFVNPTLYDIGLTRGTAADVYATTFNDVADGITNANGFGSGFASVAGYDLATGWGTPTCGLLKQLASNAPLTPETLLTQGELEIVTGKDDLRQDSGATVDIVFQGQTSPLTLTLKNSGDGSWDAGTTHEFAFNVPSGLDLTPSDVASGAGGVARVTLHLLENPSNSSTGEDNWDVGAISLRLFSPTTPIGEVCQLDMAETFSTLGDTNDPGVVRLSATVSASGSGPNVEFPISGGVLASNATPPLAGLATGCASTGSGLPAAPGEAEFIIATGNDTIRSDSTAMLQVFGADTSAPPFLQATIPSGGQSGDVFIRVLPLPSGAPPAGDWHLVLTLTTHNSFIETDDHWDVAGVTVLTWPADQPEQCVLTVTGDPAISELGGSSAPLPANHCE